MTKRRLSPNQLAELKANFAGLKQITGYTSIKDEYKVASIQIVETEIDTLLVREAQLLVKLDEVRDLIAARGGDFSDRMVGATQQVVAQFGDDSPEIQAVGRKRRSDRAPRRPKSGNPTNG